VAGDVGRARDSWLGRKQENTPLPSIRFQTLHSQSLHSYLLYLHYLLESIFPLIFPSRTQVRMVHLQCGSFIGSRMRAEARNEKLESGLRLLWDLRGGRCWRPSCCLFTHWLRECQPNATDWSSRLMRS
jgi:hypothetical protein